MITKDASTKKIKDLESEVKELREMLHARDERHRLDVSCLNMVENHMATISWASSLFSFLASNITEQTEMLEAAAAGRNKT